MALTKEKEHDKIEIVGKYKILQCREATVIKEDGVEISRSYFRYVVTPSISDEKMSTLPQEVQDIADTVWSDQLKQDYIDFQASQIPEEVSPPE